MPRHSTTPAVLQYIQERPGRPITCNEIMDRLGLDARQVQPAVWRIVKDEMLPGLRIIQGGQVWQYDEGATSVLAHDLLLTFLRELDPATGLYVDDTNGIFKVVKIA